MFYFRLLKFYKHNTFSVDCMCIICHFSTSIFIEKLYISTEKIYLFVFVCNCTVNKRFPSRIEFWTLICSLTTNQLSFSWKEIKYMQIFLILLCQLMISEVKFCNRIWTFMLEIHYNFFCFVRDNTWVAAWQNGVWHESEYELDRLTLINTFWIFAETNQWMWAQLDRKWMCE